MIASEIMTRDVTTVSPSASVREAAKLMVDRRLSGLPVVTSDGQPVGMLTASDLLHRVETGTEKRPSWFTSFFSNPDDMARQYAKAHGLKAHEVMSRHVISVRHDADLSEVADVLDRNGLKRVPVVQDGLLVGIVSRSDLVRVLSEASVGQPIATSGDAAVQNAIWQAIRKETWLNSGYVNITVKDGVVEAWGMVGSQDQRNALMVLVEEAARDAKVQDHLKVGVPSTTAGWV
jgi:CBS-domain-containing membrane protein